MVEGTSNVCVIGTGYVGLVTGSCLAVLGASVTCIDIDKVKIKRLQKGEIPIYEPGLEAVVLHSVNRRMLAFSTGYEAVSKAQYIFLAVPTPCGPDGLADLSYVFQAVIRLKPLLQPGCQVVVKSTVPVGTADKIRSELGSDPMVSVVSNPEFLREGRAVDDFMRPDRIVVGADSASAIAAMRALYEPLINGRHSSFIEMDNTSAEMTKYAANSFLALKVSFINEIANLCDAVGADVDGVVAGIGSDTRISPQFLRPGIGFGGSCFPKDVMALQHTARYFKSPLKTLDAIVSINGRQKTRLISRITSDFGRTLAGRQFALWGLAFKPDTDDIRESPALDMIRVLLSLGSTVVAYDPKAIPNTKAELTNGNLRYENDKYDTLSGADALIIATEWPEFVQADISVIKARLKGDRVYDGRNIYAPADMAATGLRYTSIGRPAL